MTGRPRVAGSVLQVWACVRCGIARFSEVPPEVGLRMCGTTQGGLDHDWPGPASFPLFARPTACAWAGCWSPSSFPRERNESG